MERNRMVNTLAKWDLTRKSVENEVAYLARNCPHVNLGTFESRINAFLRQPDPASEQEHLAREQEKQQLLSDLRQWVIRSELL
jgi:hypothetical protein